MIKDPKMNLYIQKAKDYGMKAWLLTMKFVKNPDNQVIVLLLAIAIVLFLIRKKENFDNVDYMYLKNDKKGYLCCDLHFTKDKPSADSVRLLKHAKNTVSIKFTKNDHYLGVNRNNLLVANPLDADCSYEFELKDNVLRSVKNGMYVASSGNDLVLSSIKERALHLKAE